jgi:preprotein translocase subunit SecG
MQTVLIVAHLIVVAVLIGLVIVQRSEGGGLGMGGGGGGMGSARAQTNALTKATMIFGILFFAGAMGLAIHANYTSRPASLLEGPRGPQAPISGGQGGGLLDSLRQNTTPQPPVQTAPEAPAAPQAPVQTPENNAPPAGVTEPPAAQPAPQQAPAQ